MGQAASELMYQAHIIMDWPSTDPTELHLARGDIVYVFEDDEHGFFKCMDSSGLVGRIPSNIVQFDEAIPAERPMQPGGRTDPFNAGRARRVNVEGMTFKDANMMVDAMDRPAA